ncbi:MAG: hypothetical protein CMJ81_22190 [Planctomycetaceae bacterium]|nr:hypothetical protein [Planctomycetaceae bacterium]
MATSRARRQSFPSERENEKRLTGDHKNHFRGEMSGKPEWQRCEPHVFQRGLPKGEGAMLKRSRKNRQRRGVLLLVVLAILAMFALLAVTYSIVAHHYRNASAVGLTLEQTEDDPRKELDRAFYDLLRDTRNQQSPLRGLSILADFYGMDGFICQLAGSASSAGATQGQFLHLPLAAGTFTDIYGNAGTLVPSPTAGFYNGQVLTVLDGPAAGVTARVVGYIPDPDFGQPVLRVAILPEGSHRRIYNLVTDLPSGTRILVNGRPFNGTGVGYDPTTLSDDDGLLNGSDGAVPYALSPNLAGQPEPILWDAISGGSDESYDAADFQNPFLAILPPDPSHAADIKPSFQMRALNNYWNGQNGEDVAANNPPLYKRISFRPNHRTKAPNQKANKFHLNNPWFDPVMDPQNPASLQRKWDVDNDSDGITDSIWMDLGYPTKTASDGRIYKPLFAVLCTDLDGRLNLNAHGHQDLSGFVSKNPATMGQPAGQGYGPAEIDLKELLGPNSEVLFSGANGKRGRYGIDFKPGRVGKDTVANAERLMPALEDSRTSEVAFHDHPEDYWDQYWKHGFGSPSDLHGLTSVSVNPYGQPVYDKVRPQTQGPDTFYPNTDSPYEMGLSTLSVRGDIATSRDTLFSTAELERVLRCYDGDAGGPPGSTLLVGRIDQLFAADPNFSRKYRNQITTEGFDVPVPSFPGKIANGDDIAVPKFPGSIVDRVRSLLRQNGFTDEALISLELEKLLSPDLLKGLRFDVNRVFGDGFDGQRGIDGPRNLVVDDPSEADMEFLAGVWMDLENDGNAVNGNQLARHLYARHLYVLMMALIEPNKTIDFHGPLEELDPLASKETAIGIAQWAINVVDFRDSDSIMTPFEFDINPFNGWHVNGDPATDGRNDERDNDFDGEVDEADEEDDPNERRIVWGCERPELLITETLAFHDRRTEDLDNDDGGEGYHPEHPEAQAPDDHDDDYDQRERPRGSLFIELYNPWTGEDRRPAEFYHDYKTNDLNYDYVELLGVRLNQRTQNDPAEGDPVWRLLIVTTNGMDDEPNPGDIERSVYFTDQDPETLNPNIQNDGHQYWANGADPAQDMTLEPGQFAVLGSARESTQGNPNVYVSELPAKRKIELDPQNYSVTVSQEGQPPGPPATCLAIGISSDTEVLNISAPIAGYQPPPINGTAYDPPLDTPLDIDNDSDHQQEHYLMKGGTRENFRVIHLQRLANPLIPYDSQANPYRTIDSMYVNLTVFNSKTETEVGADPFPPEPSEFEGTNTVADRFVTLQRGDFEAPGTNTLWQAYLPTIEIMESGRGDKGIPNGIPNGPPGEELQHTMGYRNRNYQLDQNNTFPWLLWLNRPFVNNLELLHVPHTSSARLTALFTWPASGDVPWKVDPTLYQSSSSNFNSSRYRHLLNFFNSGFVNNDASELFRVFELTHVPSRFLGTSMQLNPVVFQAGNAATEKYQAPFNQLSYFRDPGRININTIYSEKVWNAVTNGFAGPDYKQLAESRRGYPQSGDPVVGFSGFPTLFRNPFRAFGSAQLVPKIENIIGETLPSGMLPGGLLPGTHREIAATLLRPAGVFADRGRLLFQNSSAAADSHYSRHSYFRYQFLQRLGNLVTTRSNVYAIWITVGYFEVDPQTGEPGLERGLEGGEVNRHRAFYIVDRTIPVAFEPGKNHNVDRAVLLRRFIE